MNKNTIGFKIGVAIAAIHLCLVMFAFFAALHSKSSTSGLVYVWFYFLDAPILLLLPFSVNLFGKIAPLIQFGVFGSAMWFMIPWLIDKVVTRVFPNGTRTVRGIIISGAIPLLLVGFVCLSGVSTKLIIQRERPAELKTMLNSASSDFLTGKVIFEADALSGISSINRMNCRAGADMELLLALPREVVFLNESYQEKRRLDFSGQVFKTIDPLDMDGTHSCKFIAYKFQEGVYLFDSKGKEIWNYTQHDKITGTIDGVRFGDIDGDGKQEFAIYYRYGQGIHLVDSDGKMRWKHPVLALGHLEMADVRGNGMAEIIYSNSNNAFGTTDFTILDADGTVANQHKIATKSYEFAVIRWPNAEAKPNLLLTEERKIRIVDLKGETVMQLDAPGCRPFGDVKAVTVKFKKEEPEYLAVKKSLHPDLSVLYVYDANGKFVYQKTDVIDLVLAPTLAAVPANESGVEKLLVGSKQKNKAQVLEYSLTH